jgi:FKBP-type peptidyl-prolyl cis-trans isomerase SlyD
MPIKQDTVVSIRYTLKDDAGEVIESSPAGHTLAYLHGRGNLVPGLERALEGKRAGEKLSVKVRAAEGFGAYDEQLVERIPRTALSGIAEVKVGMLLQVRTEHGPHTVTVTEVGKDMVTIDRNHPLAGKDLDFEVEITEVRDATQEELAHGHVHGPGGHHH